MTRFGPRSVTSVKFLGKLTALAERQSKEPRIVKRIFLK